ncbi:hypothetical protein TNCV_2516201 [Trichonephila clavipes]|nr:hypothetical protein TNCV_2516201 [Trichonephila clavipes]
MLLTTSHVEELMRAKSVKTQSSLIELVYKFYRSSTQVSTSLFKSWSKTMRSITNSTRVPLQLDVNKHTFQQLKAEFTPSLSASSVERLANQNLISGKKKSLIG